jgi:hypothetical protein
LPRLLPTVLVVLLLAGTAAAFAVTESMKLKTAAITATQVDKVFSPVCRCPTRIAHVRFRLTSRNRLQVAILRDGKVVRTLEPGMLYGRGPKHFEWNGRDDAGRLAPDGAYDPRVVVGGQTISLPNPIVLDTVRPRVHGSVSVGRSLVVHYRLSERAHPIVYLNGRRVVFGRWQRLVGTLRLPGRWTQYSPKTRLRQAALRLGAQDLAGNLALRVPLSLPR